MSGNIKFGYKTLADHFHTSLTHCQAFLQYAYFSSRKKLRSKLKTSRYVEITKHKEEY